METLKEILEIFLLVAIFLKLFPNDWGGGKGENKKRRHHKRH